MVKYIIMVTCNRQIIDLWTRTRPPAARYRANALSFLSEFSINAHAKYSGPRSARSLRQMMLRYRPFPRIPYADSTAAASLLVYLRSSASVVSTAQRYSVSYSVGQSTQKSLACHYRSLSGQDNAIGRVRQSFSLFPQYI